MTPLDLMAANQPMITDWLAAWGQWAGAVATFAAVVVSLLLARKDRGRVMVVLEAGAMDLGTKWVLAPPDKVGPDWLREVAAQGFVRPVVAVEVVNVGGRPVTVKRWGLGSPQGVTLYDLDAIGPSLPHRLEVGTSATWLMNVEPVQAFMHANKHFPKRMRWRLSRGAWVCAVVELVDGRKRRSKEVFRDRDVRAVPDRRDGDPHAGHPSHRSPAT